MAKIYMTRQGNSLIPVGDSDFEAVQKLKRGEIYSSEVTAPRNIKFHRKLFALLNLTFDYWQPESMVSEIEKQTVTNLKKYMAHHGVTGEAIDALCHGFVQHLENHRQEYSTGKDFESFREYVTIKAGFFNAVATPSGLRKVAKSISFAKMDDVDFANCYKQILNVCWQLCLHKVFENQEQLAESLLRFE